MPREPSWDVVDPRSLRTLLPQELLDLLHQL
jgi:hypothetical protein